MSQLYNLVISILLTFCMVGLDVNFVSAQDPMPSAPSLLNSNSSNSLLDLLRADLLKRAREADQGRRGSRRRKPYRPQPELGGRSEESGPMDISKYIGPEGDPEKTLERLQDLGKIPSAPSPPQATDPMEERLDNVPVDRRLAYAEDLLERREYKQAQDELEEILEKELKNPDLLRALTLREKTLFHQGFHDTVQDDYYQLKNYYPDSKQVGELKQYLEEKAGLSSLQKTVKENPANPAAQRKLLDTYLKYGWLDFAEDFFGETIQDTSQATIQSLSEVFYRQNDFQRLVDLSELGQKLYPSQAIYLYNEGVGHYSLNDPASMQQAKSLFMRAKLYARQEGLKQKADWYLKRLEQ